MFSMVNVVLTHFCLCSRVFYFSTTIASPFAFAFGVTCLLIQSKKFSQSR